MDPDYVDMVINIGPEYFDEESQEHMANRAMKMIEKGVDITPEMAREIIVDELCRHVIKYGRDIIYPD